MIYDFIIFTPFRRGGRKLGGYRIASLLREQGLKVKVIDFWDSLVQLEPLNEQFILKLKEKHTHKNTIFGFSTTFLVNPEKPLHRQTPAEKSILGSNKHINQHTISEPEKILNFFSTLRKSFPNNKFVIGGQNARKGMAPNYYYEKSNSDYLFTGYSESAAVKELINIFNGIPEAKHIHSLSEDWDFSNTTSAFYKGDLIYKNETLPLEVSRGCRFKCKFCSFPLLGRKISDKYIRKTHHLYNELIHNYEHFGVTNYNILCDTFNETTEKLLSIKNIFDKFKAFTNKNIQFVCYLRLELIHRYPEQIDLLKSMGLAGAQFGIETLNYESAKAVGKGIRTEDVYKTLSKVRDSWGSDANIGSGFIIGLPHETRETANKWLNDLYDGKTLLSSWKVDALRISQFSAKELTNSYPSEFALNAEKYGYKFDTNNNWYNDYWSLEECSDLAIYWNEKFKELPLKRQNIWNSLAEKNNFNPYEKDRKLIKDYFSRILTVDLHPRVDDS